MPEFLIQPVLNERLSLNGCGKSNDLYIVFLSVMLGVFVLSSLALSYSGQEFFYLRKNFRNQPALPVIKLLEAVEEVIIQHTSVECFSRHN